MDWKTDRQIHPVFPEISNWLMLSDCASRSSGAMGSRQRPWSERRRTFLEAQGITTLRITHQEKWSYQLRSLKNLAFTAETENNELIGSKWDMWVKPSPQWIREESGNRRDSQENKEPGKILRSWPQPWHIFTFLKDIHLCLSAHCENQVRNISFSWNYILENVWEPLNPCCELYVHYRSQPTLANRHLLL